MIILFLLAPPCEEQKQVESNVVGGETKPRSMTKGYSPRGISNIWRQA